MQTCYDRLMVRPSVNLLRQALDEALAAGNGGDAVLHVEAGSFDRAVGAARPLREGFREWSDVRYYGAVAVAMVWWTDHARRRHFRVMAERWPGWSGLGPRDGMIARGHPPLWLASLGQCFRVRTGAGEGWRVVCPCGEAGEMRALAWMGTRCAACHDRAQEGAAAPVAARLGRVSREEADAGACRLEVKEEDGAVVVRRRPEGEEVLRHVLPPLAEGVAPPVVRWVVSPDETALLVTSPECATYRLREGVWGPAWAGWEVAGHLRAFALAEGGAFAAAATQHELAVVDAHGEPVPAEQVVIGEMPVPTSWTLLKFQGREVMHRLCWGGLPFGEMNPPVLTTWAHGQDGWRCSRRLDLPPLAQAWFSPDGRWLATTEEGRPGVAFRCLVTGEDCGGVACFLHMPVEGVTFLPDGGAIFTHEPDAAHHPYHARRVNLHAGGEAGSAPNVGPAVRVPWRLLLGLGPP